MLAEFATPEALLEGTRKMREKGWKGLDTHTPYPVHGIEAALGLGRPKIPNIVLAGGLAGVVIAYCDDVLHERRRLPHQHRQPAAALAAGVHPDHLRAGGAAGRRCRRSWAAVALFKLPQPYHPLFESENFRRASIDAYFLSVELGTGKRPEDVMDDARLVGAVNVEVVEESER